MRGLQFVMAYNQLIFESRQRSIISRRPAFPLGLNEALASAPSETHHRSPRAFLYAAARAGAPRWNLSLVVRVMVRVLERFRHRRIVPAPDYRILRIGLSPLFLAN
jgi:hypothetical protein